jgi:hypothetical protein
VPGSSESVSLLTVAALVMAAVSLTLSGVSMSKSSTSSATRFEFGRYQSTT